MFGIITALALLQNQTVPPSTGPTETKSSVSSHTRHASDFFPLHIGDVFGYEDIVNKQAYPLNVEVRRQMVVDGKTVDVKGQPVMQLVVDTGTPQPEIVYYYVDGDTVKVYTRILQPELDDSGKPIYIDPPKDDKSTDQVAKVKKMFVKVYSPPIFQMPIGDGTWAYSGRTLLQNEGENLSLHGSSKYAGSKVILGKKRDLISVTLDQSVGAHDGPELRSHSESLYAEGIGLYEMTETNRVGKKQTTRIRRLVSYEPAQGKP